MTTAVYIRVSSFDQNPEGQRAEVQAWLDRNGITGALWFEDKESGKTLKRPAFEALQRAIFDGQVKTIVVWKLDRLARSLRDGINLITDWLERDLRIISVTQAIDMSGVLGRMIAGILFAVAEMELSTMKERQSAGIRVAKRKGVYKGRKPGTRKGSPARAQQLKQRGFTEAEIAAALGVSTRTVNRYLQQAAERPQ